MVRELADGVWHIDLSGTNAYLVADDALTLVDAGMPWHADDIATAVADAGHAVSEVERVLLTHYDLDHVGGLPRLKGLDATVYAGERETDLVAGREKPSVFDRKGAFQRLTGLLTAPPSARVEPVRDGDTIGSFTAYHTPGHTPGHVAYVSEQLGVAFLGDLVRESGGELEPSPWYLSHDTDDVRASIRDLADRAPDFDIACIGHGTPLLEGGRDALRRLA
ncbi:MBL fold metallo-hydrolase [Salarchaeum sp. III]|uniref:MBL fold metallo-hydrolase n=1 Tax=Salarchaeum sp. III TaxID=3107927 RepID=UPI002EDB9BC9